MKRPLCYLNSISIFPINEAVVGYLVVQNNNCFLVSDKFKFDASVDQQKVLIEHPNLVGILMDQMEEEILMGGQCLFILECHLIGTIDHLNDSEFSHKIYNLTYLGILNTITPKFISIKL